MAKLDVYQFPARSDNFGVLVHDPDTGATASIDAPDADAVLAASIFHFREHTVAEAKQAMADAGITVRPPD